MLKTVLVSIGTSLVVSLITFILGLKSGKNQTDRAKLQELYKQLFCHFNDIREGIKNGRPKRWEDYKKEENLQYITFYPLVREMDKNGEIVYLKKKTAQEAKELEVASLSYAYETEELIRKIQDKLSTLQGLYTGELTINDSQNNKNNSYSISTVNINKCNSHRTESYLRVLHPEEFKQKFIDWEKNSSYALKLTTRGNPPRYSFTIYPGAINCSASEYTDTLLNTIKEDIPEYLELKQKEEQLLVRLDKITAGFAKRAKEPTTFWETFLGAFTDIFH